MTQKVFIIILHIGSIQVTKDCIASLEKNENKYAKILLINNDTNVLLKKDFPFKKLVVINNKKNLGFAGGVNIGIKYARKENASSVFLLNNDTYIKKPFLESLTRVLEDSSVGIVGPAICFEKDGKKIFDIGGRINAWTGRTSHLEVRSVKEYSLRPVTYITGAAMLIRKEVFKKIGLFDTDFFLYYEDADFCIRAKKAGFKVVVVPSVTIYHLLSKTIGKVTPFAVFYQTRSGILFGKKHIHNPFKKIIHLFFILSQTILIAKTSLTAGLAGLKAIFVFSSEM